MTSLRALQKYLVPLLLLLVLAAAAPPPVAGEKLDEYQVKAGFVLNFALLSEWPAEVQMDK